MIRAVSEAVDTQNPSKALTSRSPASKAAWKNGLRKAEEVHVICQGSESCTPFVEAHRLDARAIFPVSTGWLE